METPSPMGKCMGLWVDGWGHVKSLNNRINLQLIEMWSQASYTYSR